MSDRPAKTSILSLMLLGMCLLLGLATAVGAAWASAAWMPVESAHATVALNGNHLEPWQIRLALPGATRLIWFEKGRIYNRGLGPAGGSSAAVACWSYATNLARLSTTVNAPFGVPDRVREQASHNAGGAAFSATGSWKTGTYDVWGIAEDQRGWPLPAMRGWIVGTMEKTAVSPWVYESAAALPMKVTQQEHLASLRALPLLPMWRGLVVDGVVFAAGWWCVLTASAWTVRTIVARVRIPRGHCPNCGYDLQGVDAGVCPECGRARVGKEST